MAQMHVMKDADAAEWALRVDLAATFRLSAREKWNEGIGNHNSAMIVNTEYMLINPRGMLFQEVTASNLITCDLDGKVLRGKGELRKVAFHIHARIHLNAPSAACIVHVHPQYLTALSMMEGGRLALDAERAERLADGAHDRRGQALADDAADVVGAEDFSG